MIRSPMIKRWHPATLFVTIRKRNSTVRDSIVMGKSAYKITALCFLLGLWRASRSVAETPVFSPAQTNRLVCGYALTSANDFPQRDPMDWRLLASRDGGRTWTTLDTR